MGTVILSIRQDFVQRCHFKLRPPFQQMTIEYIAYHKSVYLSMVFLHFSQKVWNCFRAQLYELTRNMSEADLNVLISTAERLNDK